MNLLCSFAKTVNLLTFLDKNNFIEILYPLVFLKTKPVTFLNKTRSVAILENFQKYAQYEILLKLNLRP